MRRMLPGRTLASTDGAVPTEDSAGAAPADVETLLVSATTQLDGRSVRGEATIELAPGFGLSTNFESDAEGDLAATVEIPPGMDPEFPGGADAEVRYVGGVVYVRPPVPAEVLAELGLDEAWYVDETAMTADPMAQAMGSAGGLICLFPQSLMEPLEGCDPAGETRSLPGVRQRGGDRRPGGRAGSGDHQSALPGVSARPGRRGLGHGARRR